MGSTVDEEKWNFHYSSHHKILVVGEGDFSFAACLARAFGNASNMIATSLDSLELLEKKHPTAAENLVLLKDKGCTVLHEIDICSMSRHPILENKRFDKIVRILPHVGFGYPHERSDILNLIQQDVVRGFLRDAYEMLTWKYEVDTAHKLTYHYTDWKIEELGQEVGLKLRDREIYDVDEYPGYVNESGDGDCSNDHFPVRVCCTFKFVK